MNIIKDIINYHVTFSVILIFFHSLVFIYSDWIKAAESAFAEKDVASLNEIQARQGRNPDIAQMVKQMKAKLGVL